MARVERPEIGTEMYAVFEHRYYIPGHAAPVMEYCVCKGAVRGFFAGGYTEVSLLFTGPDGFPEPDYPDHFTGGIRMNENDLFNFQLEYTFTADWLAELDRQLALLLSTREGTMPLDRAFGLNMDFVDMPPEAAKSLYTAEVTEKVSKFIPEVRVQEVTWTGGNTGKLFPKVVITSA